MGTRKRPSRSRPTRAIRIRRHPDVAYLSIITLIFYRFTFLELTAAWLTPPYWINMGAVAITTLAGSNLLLVADTWPFLAELRPFLTGFTLFFWVTATWWMHGRF